MTSTIKFARLAGLLGVCIPIDKSDPRLETFRALIAHDATVAAMEEGWNAARDKALTLLNNIHDREDYRQALIEMKKLPIPLPPENKP